MAISAPTVRPNDRSIANPGRFGLLAVAVSLIIHCSGFAHGEDSDSILQFTTDDFFGGVVVRLDKLRENERYDILPLDILVPSAVCTERFDPAISEFVVYLKDSTDLNLAPMLEERFEVAAVARFAQPVTVQKLPGIFTQWQSGGMHWQNVDAVHIDSLQLDGSICYRVPSGTILNARRRFAALSFTNSEGQESESGINIGGLSPQRYVEGQTQSKAVFSFNQISESDLIGNTLEIDLRLDVFATRRLEHEYCQSQMYLRQPGGKLRSDAIVFDAKSFSNHRITFPRRLSAEDVNGKKHDVDLIDGFVTKDGLEVVLECKDKNAYVGVTARDLSIRNEAYEYIAIEGDFLVVAQSPDTLRKMLSRNAGSLSRKLETRDNQEIVATFDIRNASELTGLKHFLNSLLLEEAAACLPQSMTTGRFSVTMDEQIVMTAEIELPKSAIPSLKARIAQQLSRSKLHLQEVVSTFVRTQDAKANLVRTVFPEFSGVFPDGSIDRTILQNHLTGLVDRLFDSVKAEVLNDKLSINCKWPVEKPISQLDELDRVAYATLQSIRADYFKVQTDFVSSVEILHRLIRLFPEHQSLWERVAHEICFNISREFDGSDTRYFWVRDGINILLDGAERNPKSVDLVWIAAKFIEKKIGRSEESREFRKLFAKDIELHRRLQRYSHLDRDRDSDDDMDCYATAKQMFEYCIRESTQSATISIPPFLIASQSVVGAAGNARTLDDDGNFEEAAVQWKIVEDLCEELGKKEINYNSQIRLQIRDAERHWSSIDEPLLGTITLDYAWYATQVFQARLEQNKLSRTIREHEFRARELLRQMKKLDALGEYQVAMQQLATIVQEDSDVADHTLRNFSGLLNAFRELSQELERPTPPDLRKIIDRSNSLERHHLLDWRLR